MSMPSKISGKSTLLSALKQAFASSVPSLILACNEAEKAANIKLIDYRMIGASGRLYISGDEAEVRNARDAAEQALRAQGAV